MQRNWKIRTNTGKEVHIRRTTLKDGKHNVHIFSRTDMDKKIGDTYWITQELLDNIAPGLMVRDGPFVVILGESFELLHYSEKHGMWTATYLGPMYRKTRNM